MTERPLRLLIVRLGSLGDVIHAIPAVASLRARYPSARIDWLIDPRYLAVLQLVRGVDQAIPLDTRGPLAELTARLASHAPSHALHARVPSGETELLRHMHGIWSRLSADRRLTQSLAKVPDKAGPLNSHHLVHRALAAMREASPGYFHHFVAQVDALLALDLMMQAAPAAPSPAAAGPAAPRQRKGGRTKAP